MTAATPRLVAAQTGIVMVVYLDETYRRSGEEGRLLGPDDTAAPVVGGLLSCIILTLLVLPAAYASWRHRRWAAEHPGQ